jgi:membrane fusion protein, copper/silver efflux system
MAAAIQQENHMKQLSIAILFLTLVAGSFFAGSWYQDHKTSGNKPSVPVLADGTDADQDSQDDIDLPPGTVRISPDRQQMVGVRTGVVQKTEGEYFIRAVGRVAADEKRIYRLVAGTDGWIRETYSNDTGTFVKKDERLASFYNPLIRTTQINYLSVLGAGPDERYDAGRRQALAPSQLATVNIKTYVDALESLGMSEQQIKELAESRQVKDKVFIMAPATGYIIARNVSAGQRFEKGFEWYQIANLDKVWILADLFPNDAGDAKPGVMARVILPGRNKEFHAAVTKVLPQLDSVSRTLKLRLELDNPGHLLRPDMLVNVELPVARPEALTVPADAILASGLRNTVFVEHGNGYFEPREVQTGRRFRGMVEITAGLSAGERIVTSGNFLIDSESKLALAALGMQAALSKDPVCGREISPRKAEKAGLAAGHGGRAYYFDSEACREQFQKDPERYAQKAAAGDVRPQPVPAPQPPDHMGHAHK